MTEREAFEAGFALGSIKWFDHTKGFGFIVPDETNEVDGDVFVHASKFQDIDLQAVDGMRVAFKHRLGDKGWAATEVAHVERI